MLINRLLLGGYNFGGLIRPFNNKAPRRATEPPPTLLLGLRMWNPEPAESEWINDERELEQRGRAHYVSYQWIASALPLILLILSLQNSTPRLVAHIPFPVEQLAYEMLLATIVVSQTLPQAVLLWTEPDMEEFGPEA